MALTVPLAEGIWRVPLIGDFTNGFLLRDADGQVTVLDMGLPFSGKRVMKALASIGSDPSDVTRLLLTHCHPDHAGGAAYVAERTGREVSVHADDADYVRTGTQPPTDPTVRTSLLARLLPQGGAPPAPVAEEPLRDGQVLDVAGGLEVVHTPGHSPGHCSYLHRDSGLLITGDAIFNVLGLRWPMKMLCSDFRMTQQTAHHLAELDYTTAAFTHGPEITDRPREAIRTFLAKAA
ncbi:MBL fold metallo-hydrolase [Nocardioides sp. HDW12B]|uniref:MBL fold metallo-hydrolase n=1 Tax=Nocardioides sp. HDW12B TaxID=2714939 RepID=UPI00140E1442|nr:MBL fold metallo-hydrolase [Nocardioides sp. HDW12B]QIK67974.1 MBL fold metallo-hydrolase [Nocardioides sp. HDW12B]